MEILVRGRQIVNDDAEAAQLTKTIAMDIIELMASKNLNFNQAEAVLALANEMITDYEDCGLGAPVE